MAVFFLPSPADYYSEFNEEYECLEWETEGAFSGTRGQYEGDTDHPLCLFVDPDANQDGKGVYRSIQDVLPLDKYVLDFSYKNQVGQEIDILVRNQVASSTILAESVTATIWSNYYKELTVPAACTSLRVFLRAGTAATSLFFIDDIKCQGNALPQNINNTADRQPDTYTPIFPAIDQDQQTIGSQVRSDRTAVNARLSLGYSAVTSAQFQRLLDMHRSNEHTYFNDLDVPPMVDIGTFYETSTYNFSGISTNSTTHIANVASSATQPAAKGDFQVIEFSDADYDAIDADDSSSAQDAATTNGDYIIHAFRFDVSEDYSSANQVRSLSIEYKGACNDDSTENQDGQRLLLWNVNAENWVAVSESRVSDKETLAYSTSKPEQAQLFVDTSDGYIRALIQSQGFKGAGQDVTLDSYWAQAIVNESLSETVTLRNKALLDGSGDVIHVKNSTQRTTLTLATHYTIGDDRQSVIIKDSAADAGDVIEVKYNQYYKVKTASFGGSRIPSVDESDPKYSVQMQLKVLVGI